MGREALQHKLDVLRGHCEAAGTDYDAIEKTVQVQFDAAVQESPAAMLERLAEYASLGFTRAIGSVREVQTLRPLELLARDVIPQAESL